MDMDMNTGDPPQGMDVDLEGSSSADEDGVPDPLAATSQCHAQDQLCTKTYVNCFPSNNAGAPAHQHWELLEYDKVSANQDNIYFPF